MTAPRVGPEHAVSVFSFQRLISQLELGKQLVQVEVWNEQRERHARVVAQSHRRARDLVLLGNVKP